MGIVRDRLRPNPLSVRRIICRECSTSLRVRSRSRSGRRISFRVRRTSTRHAQKSFGVRRICGCGCTASFRMSVVRDGLRMEAFAMRGFAVCVRRDAVANALRVRGISVRDRVKSLYVRIGSDRERRRPFAMRCRGGCVRARAFRVRSCRCRIRSRSFAMGSGSGGGRSTSFCVRGQTRRARQASFGVACRPERLRRRSFAMRGLTERVDDNAVALSLRVTVDSLRDRRQTFGVRHRS